MITNILFKNEYNIDIAERAKIEIGDITTSIKEIPIVRFRPQEINENTIDYIKTLRDKFSLSVILVELNIEYDNTYELLRVLNNDEYINIAIYLRVDIDNEDIDNDCKLINHKADKLRKCISLNNYERIMMVDKASDMYYMNFRKIKDNIMDISGAKEENIGICGSPLSFGEDCCLTAIKAREILANYGENGRDGVIPSAKHENMNVCGCIRHVEVKGDLICRQVGKNVVKSNSAKKGDNTKSAHNKSRGRKIMKKLEL